jgi:hypothetical protein
MGLMSIFYCLYFWDSPNLEGQVPVFISFRNSVAELYPRVLGYCWVNTSVAELHYDWRSVNVSWCRANCGLVTRLHFPSEGFCRKSCFFCLWQEVGPDIYQSQSVVICLYEHEVRTFHVFTQSSDIQIRYTRLHSVPARYSRLCVTSSSCYHGSLDTWTVLQMTTKFKPFNFRCWNSPCPMLRTFKFKLYCDRRSVGQFVLVSGPLWSIWPDFTFLCVAITLFLLHVGCPLWWEDGSAIRNAITQVQVKLYCDRQSARSSWCRVPLPDLNFLLFNNYFLSFSRRAPSPISPWTGWSSPKSKSR